MVFKSRHCLTKGRSVAQGNDGMEPGEPNWRDPAVSASQASPRTRQTIRIGRFFYVSDVSPLINWIEETSSLHSGASPHRPVNYPDVSKESNPTLNSVFHTLTK